MTESEFLDLTDALLDSLQTALDAANLDLDYQLNGGVLEIEFDHGGKIVINRHLPNQEMWLAAKSGGFHFSLQENGHWSGTRDGADFHALLSQLISQGCGETFDWAA